MPKNQYRHNGRFAKKKVIEQKRKCQEGIEKKRRESRNLKIDNNRPGVCAGNRIVDLEFLGEQLVCQKCEKILSLTKIERETLLGLHSIIYIRCPSCLALKAVNTGDRHKVNEGAQKIISDKMHYDLTTNGVLGRKFILICMVYM